MIKNKRIYILISLFIIAISVYFVVIANRYIDQCDFYRILLGNTISNTANQTIFTFLITVYGAIIGLCFLEELSYGMVVFGAPMVGVSLWLFFSKLLLCFNIPYTWYFICAVLLIFIVVCIIIKKPNYKLLISFDAVTIMLCYFSISFLLSVLNLSHIVGDSNGYIVVGKVLAETKSLKFVPVDRLASNSVITSLLFSPSTFFNFDYCNGFYCLYGLSFIASISYYIYFENKKYLKQKTALYIGAVSFMLFMMSGLFTLIILFYPISNSPSAINLFLGIYFAYVSKDKKNRIWISLFFMILAVWARSESPILVLGMIFIISSIDVDKRTLVKYTAIVLAFLNVWYIKFFSLSNFSFSEGEFLTDARAMLIIVAFILLIVYFILCSKISFFKKNEKIFELVFFGLIIAAILYLGVNDTGKFINNIKVTISNLFVTGKWGNTWLVLITLLCINYMYVSKIDIWDRCWIIYGLLLMLMFMLRYLYLRQGMGDSLNRLLIFQVPVMMFIIFTRLPKVLLSDKYIK